VGDGCAASVVCMYVHVCMSVTLLECNKFLVKIAIPHVCVVVTHRARATLLDENMAHGNERDLHVHVLLASQKSKTVRV
jgi:hypothetical protein